MTATKKEEGPRERVEGFIDRRGEDAGEFVSIKQLSDGYVQVEFEKAIYFTPVNDKVVYRDGCGYERPALKRTR